MSLLDRFRPKWQHSDTEVRAAAVRQLGKEDFELLSAVAQSDEDPRVRRIALKKLDDPRLLLEIGRNDPDEGLRAFARERACAILVEIAVSHEDQGQSERAVTLLSDQKQLAEVAKTARLDSIRKRALEHLTDEKALADVARNAEDPAISMEALGRVNDPSTLRAIASGDSGVLAMAALERIKDPELFYTISEDRAVSRTLRRRAKAKLDELVGEDHPFRLKDRQAHLASICREMESLVEEPDPALALEQAGAVRSQWESLAGSDISEPALKVRFEQARQSVQERAARQERRKAEEEQRAREREENRAARVALSEKVEQLEAQAVPTELPSARSLWDALGPVTDEQSKKLGERFKSACEEALGRHRAWTSWRERLAKLEALVEKAEQAAATPDLSKALKPWTDFSTEWASLSPSTLSGQNEEETTALLTRFQDAQKRIRERKDQDRELKKKNLQENLGVLRALCERLEEMSSSENLRLKEAFEELRKSQDLLREMGALPPGENRRKWRARLTDARRKLHLRVQVLQETDDWRRWANVDLQEKLIRRMEALRELDDLVEVARELRDIQLEWKKVSAVPRSRSEELWQRFKKARDEVRARCEAYFAELNKQRNDNLERKKLLCEKVEALAESSDWEKAALGIKRVQEEWKAIGTVPHRESMAIWKRFRKACDHFFDRRKEHYDRLKGERESNLAKKIEMCEKAEALAESIEWNSTLEQFKQLQAEWKRVGPVPRKKSDAVWKRFRKACDHFFERYKRRDDLALAENLLGKEAICQELEALVSSNPDEKVPDARMVADTVQRAWSRWQTIGLVPEAQEDHLEKRFRDVCEKLIAKAADGFHGTELDPSTNRKKRERLCERLEELVNACSHDRSDTGSMENLAERLKNALAARTIGGDTLVQEKTDWRAATQKVKRLKASWERLGPVPGEEGVALAARFQKAYTHFFELLPETTIVPLQENNRNIRPTSLPPRRSHPPRV